MTIGLQIDGKYGIGPDGTPCVFTGYYWDEAVTIFASSKYSGREFTNTVPGFKPPAPETVTATIRQTYRDLEEAGYKIDWEGKNPSNNSNSEFVRTNHEFLNACKKVGIVPSTRQASKYRRRKGAAFAASIRGYQV